MGFNQFGGRFIGDEAFRDGDMETDNHVRYGYRCFHVFNETERKVLVRPGGMPLRGPLKLTDNPANGTLVGPYKKGYHYGPGLNVATCMPYSTPSLGAMRHAAPYINHAPDCNNPNCKGAKGSKCQRHGCGFYAYGAPDHPDADPHNVPMNTYAEYQPMFVNSVVQCSGRRILGSKGFLSEKLRIVAITLPIVCTTRGNEENELKFDLFSERLAEMVVRNYPDVATFDNVADMVATFPLTKLPGIKPPEPNPGT